MTPKNNYQKKIKRTITSVLPKAKNRRGRCVQCGKCCFLPKRCFFLKTEGDHTYCTIYKVRPLNCRKYPRTKSEQLTADTCGYYFE